MNRAMTLAHLQIVQCHVEQAERHIVKQRAIIERLRLLGHNVDSAENVLAVLEKFQALHIDHRDRLQLMLGRLSPQMATQ